MLIGNIEGKGDLLLKERKKFSGLTSRNKKSYLPILRKDYIGQPEVGVGEEVVEGKGRQGEWAADCGVVFIFSDHRSEVSQKQTHWSLTQ